MTIAIRTLLERECEFIGLPLRAPLEINSIGQRVPPRAFANDLTRAI